MTVAQVAAAAIVSRGWVSLMAMFSHAFITPYDTSAIAHSKSIFSAFAAWDGVYFVGIADQGYRYENTHAFFPLFPLLVRWTSPLMLPFLDKNASLLAAGWLISNASFVVAAVFLYLLGLEVLKTESVAKRAALLFCICPSGIFMSACYSESLMCALTFSGMYLLERSRTARRASGPMFLIFSALLFGLSSATRSNGILHSLYIAYYQVLASPHPVRAFPQFVAHWTFTASLGAIAIGFQVAYFLHGIAAYCASYASAMQVVRSVFHIAPSALAADRPWCSQVVPNFTAMYMFIQREYWGVAPFAYYELKQVRRQHSTDPLAIPSSRHRSQTSSWRRPCLLWQVTPATSGASSARRPRSSRRDRILFTWHFSWSMCWLLSIFKS
ncbi:hypothetical protein, variant 2 [Aphanomyces invadans]|uniref:GPI mannosyltransferase 2 n=1 Tax=Aphanomyces invadans TaxID=157072 RepID=A0A024TVN9_9STRA|nr:hypothetical protein, variant 2 [Aphanomyces invadans]ETV98230.1 hypothetical protein, variant 2 [Aphanomyces invadans]|eukprot:XP_008873105.1 hypothetical protein, variant 2 [Aphanomyces invadans]